MKTFTQFLQERIEFTPPGGRKTTYIDTEEETEGSKYTDWAIAFVDEYALLQGLANGAAFAHLGALKPSEWSALYKQGLSPEEAARKVPKPQDLPGYHKGTFLPPTGVKRPWTDSGPG